MNHDPERVPLKDGMVGPKLTGAVEMTPSPVAEDEGRKPEYSLSVDEAIEDLGLTSFHIWAAFVVGLGNAADAVELLAISYVLPLLDITDTERGIVSSGMFAGMLVGGIVAGAVSDRIGRKPMLIASLTINVVFGLLSAVSPDWIMIAIARVCSGFGVGGSIPSVFTLYAELLPVHQRGFYLSIIAWFWMVGSIYAAGMAWLLIGVLGLSWRIFLVTAAAPSAIAAVLLFFTIPESPRFLYSKERLKHCRDSILYMAKWSGVPSKLNHDYVLYKESETHEMLTSSPGRPSSVSAGSAYSCASIWNVLVGSWETLMMFFHPSLRQTSSMLMISWFCLSFGWYGLILWIPTLFEQQNFVIDVYMSAFFVAAANLPGNIVSAYLMDRIGRKSLLAYSMVLSAGMAVVFAFSRTAALTVTAACFLNAISIGGWNALDCLSTESFPTKLRTSALGILAACGRIGSIVGQFAFGALIDINTTALLCVAAGMLAIGAVSGMFLPNETSGVQLAEGIDESNDGTNKKTEKQPQNTQNDGKRYESHQDQTTISAGRV